MTASESLFDRLGGQDAIDAVVDEFYDRILSDERVAHHFEDTDMTELRVHQAQFIAVVTGGPVEYDGADVREAHEGMGITDEEFDAVADHLDASLETYDVSETDRQQVLTEIESYRPAIVGV
jgi:hemoglobin